MQSVVGMTPEMPPAPIWSHLILLNASLRWRNVLYMGVTDSNCCLSSAFGFLLPLVWINQRQGRIRREISMGFFEASRKVLLISGFDVWISGFNNNIIVFQIEWGKNYLGLVREKIILVWGISKVQVIRFDKKKGKKTGKAARFYYQK